MSLKPGPSIFNTPPMNHHTPCIHYLQYFVKEHNYSYNMRACALVRLNTVNIVIWVVLSDTNRNAKLLFMGSGLTNKRKMAKF